MQSQMRRVRRIWLAGSWTFGVEDFENQNATPNVMGMN